MKKYFLLLFVFGLFVTSCKKNDDEVVTPKEIAEEPVVKVASDYPAQNFMWQAMNAYYFWQEDVADLADDRFASNADYAEFLSQTTDPEEFFFDICFQHRNVVDDNTAVDRFSFLNSNYKDLVQQFQGVSKSDGVEFGLARYGSDNGIFGYVRYIIPGSNAEGKDISRGDLFIGVNGTDLTLDNYIDLLFGDIDTYTLNFATLTDNTISPSGREISLTKEEGLSENPILIKKVIEQNGIKVGYLLYNSFVAAFDEQLNEAFGEFQAAGVNEVILDFRYNGGGRVSSARQIASAIYGTNTTDLFLKARYNAKIQASFQPGDGETNFSEATIDGSPINALNLSKVYIITSGSTASASELVMNGLAPYLDVIQIGTTTVGKNEFSVTMVDDPTRPQAPYIYSEERESFINPDNQWAIQPLLGRNENADGFSDYTAGLQPEPNNELAEDIANLGILGDPSEPLLALALNNISGSTGKLRFEQPIFPVELISSSAIMKANNNKNRMDGLINISNFNQTQK